MLKKQGEKKQEIHSLQDHHKQQQSTRKQPLQDLQQQLLHNSTISRPFFNKVHTNSMIMAQSITTRWTGPTFSFNTEDKPTAWREFYTRVIDYLETIDIDSEQEDQYKRGWKQIKMMFTGEDRQALQTMIDNNTITPADQCTPVQELKAIQTAIKDEEHYWHYRDKVLSDIRQHPGKQVHALNNRITTLINNCSFQDQQTTETMKIMLLQHAIRYHEVCNWIRQQDPAALPTRHSYNIANNSSNAASNFKKHNKKGELN